jgi:hypothetical protein
VTLLEELALLFEELGLGTYKPDDIDGTIYFPVLPDGPDTCLAIARYGGTESNSLLRFDEPRIQVRHRGTAADARPVEAAAQATYDALHGLGMRTLPGGTELQLAIGIGSGPEYMGRDENRRHEYVNNFRVEVQRPLLSRP